MMSFKSVWTQKPLIIIMIAAIIIRLLSVIFSKGYAMMDDHYLVIEPSQQWIDKYTDGSWLPAFGATNPSGHSLFYVGIHYFLFLTMKLLGLNDPQFKMYIVRLIHAAFSLLTVLFGYKIALLLSNKESAKKVGLLLAILWLFPFLAVRNMVEIVCIPFFLWGLWYVFKNNNLKFSFLPYLMAGFICGLSISIRFQTALLVAGLFLAFLFKRNFKEAFYYGFGALLSFALIQVVVDMIIWGRPFAEFSEYVKYNIDNRYNYFNGAWYNYIFLILGLLIPPVSFFMFYGWLRTWRKYSYIFFPSFLFLLFHLYFPNRQERFILPILPFIIISGIIGWDQFIEKSKFWKRHIKWLKISWIFFWIVNIIILIPLSVTYTKRSYVEAMSYLKNKSNTTLVVDDMNHETATLMPMFYLNHWHSVLYASLKHPYTHVDSMKNIYIKNGNPLPEYVVFLENENLQQRVDSMNKFFPVLKLDSIVEPGFIDKVMHYLNKHNKNQVVIIYKRHEI
jgi:hypothetical protein